MTTKEYMLLSLAGKNRRCEILRVELAKILSSAENPRIYGSGAKDPKEIKKMVKEAQGQRYLNLKKEIVYDGDLIEHPFVRRNDDGTFTVKEGSTRIEILKEIVKDLKEKKRPSYLDERQEGSEPLDVKSLENPIVNVYPDDMPEDAILVHVAKLHIPGKGPWEAYQKAGACVRLKNGDVSFEKKYSVIKIAQEVGISKGYVPRYIWAWHALQFYHVKHPEDKDWTDKFSHFEKLHSKPELRDWIGVEDNFEASKHLATFMSWVANKKINHAFRIAGKIGLQELIFRDENRDVYRRFEEDTNMKLTDALQLIKDNETKKKWRLEEQKTLQHAIQVIHDRLPDAMDLETVKLYRTPEGLAKIKETAKRLLATIEELEKK